MRKTWLVAQREYFDYTKSKGFWISLLSMPILIFLSVLVPALLETKSVPTRYFILIDYSQQFTKEIDKQLEQEYQTLVTLEKNKWQAQKQKNSPSFVKPQRRFLRIELPPDIPIDKPQKLKKALRTYLTGEKKITINGTKQKLFALFILPKKSPKVLTKSQYWCQNLADSRLRNKITGILNNIIQRQHFLKSGISAEKVKHIQGIQIKFLEKDPSKAKGQEKVGQLDKARQWMPTVFVYILWISTFIVAQMLLSSTIEEKANRIYEVLLSSVKSSELMFGKLLGTAAIGLTMLGFWFVSAIFIGYCFLESTMPGQSKELAKIVFEVVAVPRLLIAFGGYFLLGYLFYASLFQAIGSMCDTIKEAQGMMSPMMIVLMIPLFTMTYIPRDPHGSIAVILSWIPPFTPFIMMNRAAASPPVYEVIGTLILLVVSVALTLWISGRIFSAGILHSGKPPKIKEIWRWISSK